MLRPKEVCEHLAVSSATLRRWSDTFAAYLSPSAGRSINETGGSTQRRYTDDDLVTLGRVKTFLDAGNTYEETGRKLGEPVLKTHIVEHDNTDLTAAISLREPTTSGSMIVVETFREVLAGKDQTIQAMQETLYFQNILLEELRTQRDAWEATQILLPTVAAPELVLPSMTLWQRLDWLIRGRMIARTKKNGAEPIPKESSQRTLPAQELA